ncbi:MAG: hypothetical protein MUC36_16170 [Planctomycetes bacterium]|nr:hypothetical protein [Planctomycetota bacterium]
MDLPPLDVVLKGTLPPLGAALLLVSLAGARLLPLAMAIGLYVAFGLLKGWPELPHVLWWSPNGTQWLLWGVVAAALLGTLEHLRLLPSKVAAALAVAAAATSVWLMLGKQAARWPVSEVWLHIGGGGLAVALVTLTCRRSIAIGPAGIAPAVVFSTLLSADSVLLTLASSGLLAQMCGAVAAALGAAAGTALWKKPFALGAGDGTWIGIAHGLFVLSGVHLASLSWPVVGLALLAPLVLLALRAGAAARPVVWAVGSLLLLAVPMGAAFWLQLDTA